MLEAEPLQAAIAFLLPAGCAVCGTWIPGGREAPLVCAICRARLQRAPWPRCGRCHYPTGTGDRSAGRGRSPAEADETETNPLCRGCRDWPVELAAARYGFVLRPPATEMVRGLKYGQWPELAEPMAEAMATLEIPAFAPGSGAETTAQGSGSPTHHARHLVRSPGRSVRFPIGRGSHASARQPASHGHRRPARPLPGIQPLRASLGHVRRRPEPGLAGPGASPVVTFVPTTPARERSRGYNQARQLALHFASSRGLVLCELLERRGGERSQTTLRPSERFANVEGAFRSVEDLHMPDGAHVILVDDVLTTGATASAASRELVRAGAGRVTLMTFARAIPELASVA